MATCPATVEKLPPAKPVDPNDTCRWKVRRTEHVDNYRPPNVRGPKQTREHHMNRYLWTSITKAFVERQLAEEARVQNAMSTLTEYTAVYHKVPLDHSKADEALQKSYPLYGTAAVTVWCPKVMNKSPFKMGNCLTKPNAECYDQQFR